MFLKRITIVGFKSFANKTVLDLERGLTAVVGPNGSGKSNVADAVRWALGEQSKSRLRLGEREEVVFAGSDKRPRASLAKVTLLFDNEDGVFPLDLTEVEISRRLYRSGETEYRLAGRPVKVGDLQQLLAEAGFGAGSYAVIGQGTIDSLLLSSPAERKLLFDEAAGIRGAELKREASLRKLAATEANLVRLRDIAAELAPRAASLERAQEATVQQARLEQRVSELRASLVATADNKLTSQLEQIKAELDSLEPRQREIQAELTLLDREQTADLQRAAAAEAALAKQREQQATLESRRDQLVANLATVRGQLAASPEQSVARLKRREAELAASLAELEVERAELTTEEAGLKTQASRAAAAIEVASKVVQVAQAELMEVRKQLSDGTRQQYVGHALELVKTMARHLDAPSADVEELRLLVHKTGRLLSHASRTGEAELATRLKEAQAKLEIAMAKRETAAEHQANVTLNRRSLELERSALDEQFKRLGEEQAAAEQALASAVELERARELAHREAGRLETKLAELTARLDTVRAETQPAAVTAAVAERAVQLERLHAELAAGAARLAELGASRAQFEARLAEYRRRAHDWGVTPGTPSVDSLDDLEAALQRLEGELAARIQLGQDMQHEYDEVTQRQHDLALQIADLEAAKADLVKLVEQLSALVQERFKANFDKLSAAFNHQAARLFDGGAASLTLTEDEAGQYGITIKVSPKGKRLASLAALSGGERALAGVALLAAILATNPSPFIILDEIDAALDDANSGRLADILTELSAKSQLIVITHNRQTMKAARVLFGITMNDHHVSHLLSLHLEQATQLAAR